MSSLSSRYGIEFNTDSVCRTVYYKYLHPKHVHIGQGVLNKAFISHAWALGAKKTETNIDIDDEKQEYVRCPDCVAILFMKIISNHAE